MARLVILLLLVPVALPSPASAHRLKVFATVVGSEIQGKAYFVGGGPAANVQVTLRDVAEKVLREGRTAKDGTFALAAPLRTDMVVVADAMDGHVARFPIAAARLPESLRPGPGATTGEGEDDTDALQREADIRTPTGLSAGDMSAIEAAMARQIAPLAEEVDALQASVRLHDVLGGLGYILGVFGVLALLKARKARREWEQ